MNIDSVTNKRKATAQNRQNFPGEANSSILDEKIAWDTSFRIHLEGLVVVVQRFTSCPKFLVMSTQTNVATQWTSAHARGLIASSDALGFLHSYFVKRLQFRSVQRVEDVVLNSEHNTLPC